MVNILVTTPKSKHEQAKIEGEFVEKHSDAYWFRTLRGRPNVEIGDRVYYVDNGVITGYGIVFDIEYGELECELTWKIYKGTHLKQREWVWLKIPVPFKGFQGLRYIDRIKGLQERLDKAEKGEL